MSASPDLDRLILTMTKEEIEEGERRAMAFRPGPDPGPRIIGLKLNGFVGTGPKRLAIINGKSLSMGESVTLPIAGVKRVVTLREMKDTSVVVAAEGIAQPAELQLSR
ncbi:MAG TPA: hypothetical protein VK968_16095 [Roseimicrobium sp.]|nr:hypothetical protein [Roseimicrobium sp.]